MRTRTRARHPHARTEHSAHTHRFVVEAATSHQQSGGYAGDNSPLMAAILDKQGRDGMMRQDLAAFDTNSYRLSLGLMKAVFVDVKFHR